MTHPIWVIKNTHNHAIPTFSENVILFIKRFYNDLESTLLIKRNQMQTENYDSISKLIINELTNSNFVLLLARAVVG